MLAARTAVRVDAVPVRLTAPIVEELGRSDRRHAARSRRLVGRLMCSFDVRWSGGCMTTVALGRRWPDVIPQAPGTRLHTTAAVHHRLAAFGRWGSRSERLEDGIDGADGDRERVGLDH